MAKARYSSPSELQKRQLATVLSRQDRPPSPDHGQQSTQPNHTGTRSTNVNFESALPQHDSLICRLPPEIRSQIYLVLWREAGLAQHVYPKGIWNEHPFYNRCTIPQLSGLDEQTPESLAGAEAVTQSDPSEQAPLDKGCYFCRLKFYGSDEGRGPPPTVEKSAFLPMLLSCKTM